MTKRLESSRLSALPRLTAVTNTTSKASAAVSETTTGVGKYLQNASSLSSSLPYSVSGESAGDNYKKRKLTGPSNSFSDFSSW